MVMALFSANRAIFFYGMETFVVVLVLYNLLVLCNIAAQHG